MPHRRVTPKTWSTPFPGFTDAAVGAPPDVEGFRASRLAGLVDVNDPDAWIVVDSIRLMRIAGLDMTDPEMLRLGVEAGRRRAATVTDDTEAVGSLRKRRPRGRARRLGVSDGAATVYYMRVGNRVKIGWTASLERRLGQVNPEELLAIEPGGPVIEALRHAQFDELHVIGEWFRHEEPLITHVDTLRVTP